MKDTIYIDNTIYQKVMKRMKNFGINDPTSIIVELEKEIDGYRKRIECDNLELKKIRKEKQIEAELGEIVRNTGTITGEDKESLLVESIYGKMQYSKLQLAIFWLQHSNDCFYKTFGFSWVPDLALQEIARKKIHEITIQKMKEVPLTIPSFKIGIDLGDLSSIQSTKYLNH